MLNRFMPVSELRVSKAFITAPLSIVNSIHGERVDADLISRRHSCPNGAVQSIEWLNTDNITTNNLEIDVPPKIRLTESDT